MTSPDDALRRVHAGRLAKDQALLKRITDRHLGGPEAEAGNGETLPDAATMLAAAMADTDNEGNTDGSN